MNVYFNRPSTGDFPYATHVDNVRILPNNKITLEFQPDEGPKERVDDILGCVVDDWSVAGNVLKLTLREDVFVRVAPVGK